MVTNIDSYLQLSKEKQLAVELRAYGMGHAQIADELQKEFQKAPAITTIDHWFAVSGSLREPLREFKIYLGNQAFENIQHKTNRYVDHAIDQVNVLMLNSTNEAIRLKAAGMLLQLAPQVKTLS